MIPILADSASPDAAALSSWMSVAMYLRYRHGAWERMHLVEAAPIAAERGPAL